jgi:hypothetical protein
LHEPLISLISQTVAVVIEALDISGDDADNNKNSSSSSSKKEELNQNAPQPQAVATQEPQPSKSTEGPCNLSLLCLFLVGGCSHVG